MLNKLKFSMFIKSIFYLVIFIFEPYFENHHLLKHYQHDHLYLLVLLIIDPVLDTHTHTQFVKYFPEIIFIIIQRGLKKKDI